jgi:nucleoside-diphosphate-sugar epimerase
METLLITGASGFIGSFLAEEGLRRKYRVYAGIRKSSSKQYLRDPEIRFLEFDFSTVDRIAETLNRCKEENIRFHYIVHNAGVTKSNKKEDFYRVNFLFTKNFIEALRQTGMIPEKFIFISSLAAYGPGDPVTMEPVKLSDEPHPIELYGKSKLEAEKYIRSLEQFPWLILRPTGVYGPREKDYFVFFKTINNRLETYIGSNPQFLTFIYVKDLCRAVLDALESTLVRKAYFVSDGNIYDTETFAAITKRLLGKKTVKLRVPEGIVKWLAFGLEKVYSTWGSIPTLNTDKFNVLKSSNWKCEVQPFFDDLDFHPEYDLEKGVRETLEWYKSEGWL